MADRPGWSWIGGQWRDFRKGQFVVLKNSPADPADGWGGNYDGEVAMIIRSPYHEDSDKICVELVSGRRAGSWLKRNTEPSADPRSDALRLEHAFMAACAADSESSLSSLRQLYHQMGSPSLQGARYHNGFMEVCTPIDALYFPFDQVARTDGLSTHEEMQEKIAFLQEAGSRLSRDIFINSPQVLLFFASNMGMKIDHIDITDSVTADLGLGNTIHSQTAIFFAGASYGWDDLQDASDMIVDLLEAGADVWPFHLPGVSAACPPPESDIQSPARQQMASILWLDLVPRFEDRDGYYEGPELAPLIDRACALCTARRETRRVEGNWGRRRMLLLCYVRASRSGCAVPPAHMRSEGLRDTGVASLMLALGGHCEYCVRQIFSWL